MVGELSFEDFSSVVALIYQAATDLDLWPFFLARIATSLGAGGTQPCVCDLPEMGGRVDANGGRSSAGVSECRADCVASAAGGLGGVNNCAAYAGVVRSPGFPCRPARQGLDSHDALAGKFLSECARSTRGDPKAHHTLWTALAPHLRQACAIYRHLVDGVAARERSQAMCDRLPLEVRTNAWTGANHERMTRERFSW